MRRKTKRKTRNVLLIAYRRVATPVPPCGIASKEDDSKESLGILKYIPLYDSHRQIFLVLEHSYGEASFH